MRGVAEELRHEDVIPVRLAGRVHKGLAILAAVAIELVVGGAHQVDPINALTLSLARCSSGQASSILRSAQARQLGSTWAVASKHVGARRLGVPAFAHIRQPGKQRHAAVFAQLDISQVGQVALPSPFLRQHTTSTHQRRQPRRVHIGLARRAAEAALQRGRMRILQARLLVAERLELLDLPAEGGAHRHHVVELAGAERDGRTAQLAGAALRGQDLLSLLRHLALRPDSRKLHMATLGQCPAASSAPRAARRSRVQKWPARSSPSHSRQLPNSGTADLGRRRSASSHWKTLRAF